MTQQPEALPSGRFRGVARSAITGRRESKTFDRFGDALDWAEARERAMDNVATEQGAPVQRRPYDRPLFPDYTQAWAQRSASNSAATRSGDRSNARQLGAQWPHLRVHEITRNMVRSYMAELRDAGLSASTRQGRLIALRKIMASAVEDGHRSDDPTVGIKAPTAPTRGHRILTADELDRVVAALPTWLQAAALLSAEAGLRIGEVAGLRAHRLDLLHRTVFVADVVQCDGTLRESPKGRNPLTVPLTPRLAAALTDHIETHPPAGRTGHVFTTPNGKRLTPDRIRGEWRQAVKKAGLDGDDAPRWHDLRHGCATALARAHAPAYVIMAVLRHADLRTAQVYIDRVGTPEQGEWLGRAFGGGEQADTA